MTATYIEQNCDFHHQGRVYTSGGAIVTADYVIGYPGAVKTSATGHPTAARNLCDWHGNVIGSIVFTASWRTPRSYVASRMYQAIATVEGVRFTGRTAGEGMIFRGRRMAKQSTR